MRDEGFSSDIISVDHLCAEERNFGILLFIGSHSHGVAGDRVVMKIYFKEPLTAAKRLSALVLPRLM